MSNDYEYDYNIINYHYPYAAHPFLPLGRSCVMITSSKFE